MIIAERFLLVKMVGMGSFGKVYTALDIENNNRLVAVKMESFDLNVSHMLKEIKAIKQLEGGLGFPKLISYGKAVEAKSLYMVIPILGPSLQDLLELCGHRFSLKTTLMIFLQYLERLEFMHSRD